MKQGEKLLTPGNIVLGVIIIILIASLFFDFFGGKDEQEVKQLGCPRSIEDLILTNIMYSADGEPLSEAREIREQDDSQTEYKISALARNVGDKDIVISQLGLTGANMGDLILLDVEDVVVPSKSLKTISFLLPSGGYHKIDFYSADPCEGNVVWHEYGEGSKLASELPKTNQTATNTTRKA